MLSIEELDKLIINSKPEDKLQDILDTLEPFDAANLEFLVKLIARNGDVSFMAGYNQGYNDFKEFISQKYRLEEKLNNGIS